MNKRICVSLISLGCEKNLVDSEAILGLIDNPNVEIVNDLNQSDVIIINTCGFIDSAKEEAIDTIYDCLSYKENGCKIVVCGCLVQRYYKELKENFKDVDLFIPIRDYNRFGDLFATLFNQNMYCNKQLDFSKRVISTPSHLAYVKISEGCNNRCTYCAIPLIRGSFKSRDIESILDEVKYLVRSGRKEICLISQDLTRYGSDLSNLSLSALLKEILKIDGDFYIRLLYLYPDEITKELIQTIKDNKRVLPYFDIPIQHASNKILKWMNRRGTKEEIKDLIEYIRSEISDCTIRTTIIVGFPHETNKDFKELLEFIQEIKFDHLGCFKYSKEEDTLSYTMNNQVSNKIKEQRYNELMEVQKYISFKLNQNYIGRIYNCVIEEEIENDDCFKYVARSYMYAPDDIDGCVIVISKIKLDISKFYNVKIVEADFYDLIGEVVL